MGGYLKINGVFVIGGPADVRPLPPPGSTLAYVPPPTESAVVDQEVMAPGGFKEPGRNDPCICGSGRKYKKCCLK